MSGKWKAPDRYRLYLYNPKTGERQEALAKNHSILSLTEAKRLVKIFGTSSDYWVYRYEKM